MAKKAILEVELFPGVSVTVSDDLALKALERVLDVMTKEKPLVVPTGTERYGGMTDAGRRERDKAQAQGELSNDPGNAELKSDDPRRCAYPAARYGWDSTDSVGIHSEHKIEKRAVCSICCPYNLTCKVKHRTFDDINNPRDARTPKIEGKSDHPED